ncbi:MAG: hypothetical protein NVS2B4_03670 [Ramlibacter sp.]
MPDAADVLGKHRVIDIVRVPVHLAGDAVAQALFGRTAHLAAVTEGGELGVGRDSPGEGHPEQDCGTTAAT